MALAALCLLLLIGLWSQRKPIARGFVDRTLRARGVPARYTIAALDPGTQRLTNVVIGDPAAPDLTADSVTLQIGYGFGWPAVRAITARGVRLRGRVSNGALSLGSIDRLLPASGGGPFTLPDIRVDLTDTLVRLDTPAGRVAVAVAGRGNLANGFSGHATAAAPALATGGCTLRAVSARLAVRIADRRPSLDGPVRAASVACAGVTVAQPAVRLAATLSDALAPLTAEARIASGAITTGAGRAGAARGRIDYDGRNPHDRRGRVDLALEGVRTGQGSARALAVKGDYRFGDVVALRRGSARPVRFGGTLGLTGGVVPPARLGAITGLAGSGGATPLAPLLTAFAQAAGRAGRDVDGQAAFVFDGDLVNRPDEAGGLRGDLALSRLSLTSRSGARLRFTGNAAMAIGGDAPRIEGVADMSGGGLPSARMRVRQDDSGLAGEVAVQPYAAGGARLMLATVRLADTGGGLRLSTVATVDGPLGDGRVTGLAVPIDIRLDRRAGGALTVNPACVPLRFTRLTIAGVTLGDTRLPLCPVGGAMVRARGGVISGGMTIPRPHLVGRVGAQPLTIAAADLRVNVGAPGFVSDALAVRLGAGDAPTRLDIARLEGRIDATGVGGTFTAAAGQIANVPLLLSGGDGHWRLAGGKLALGGALTVADADPAPRFHPLVSQDVTLDLVGGVIRAGGTLRTPGNGVAVTDVSLTHDLRDGTGGATLAVPGITFGPAFQPDALTRLTVGVVANVVGTVRGEGHIAWSPQGVTSDGDFATDGIDLAAAFGPVTGIRTKIHFSDLLALRTPPGQIATIAEMNPGIAVKGGEIGYQLLPEQKVAVGGGLWPFSGGSLILEPTVLDFGRPVDRRITFRVEGMQAADFIAQFDFKNIDASGTFDGSLPMIFDDTGGRIEGGRLVVRKGGGTLAYVGELTTADLGTFGKLAFDALKSIRYDNLAILLDGRLDSEIVSRIVFTGVNENPAPGKEARGLLKNLTGLPFKFNIVIHAPFRGLTNAASAFVNPGQLIGSALPPPAAAPATSPPAAPPPAAPPPATPAVQPPLSEDKR